MSGACFEHAKSSVTVSSIVRWSDMFGECGFDRPGGEEHLYSNERSQREWIRTSLHQVLTWRSRTSENSSLVARTVRIETFDPEIRIAYVGGDCGFGSHCTVGGMRNREILGSEQNESGSSRASFRLPSTASETVRGGAVRCVIVGRFNPFSSFPSMTFQLARRSQKVDLVVARAG